MILRQVPNFETKPYEYSGRPQFLKIVHIQLDFKFTHLFFQELGRNSEILLLALLTKHGVYSEGASVGLGGSITYGLSGCPDIPGEDS